MKRRRPVDYETHVWIRRASTPPDAATDVETAAEAYRMGRRARIDHAKRGQWPGRWKDQANIEQWLQGWDDQNSEIIIAAANRRGGGE